MSPEPFPISPVDFARSDLFERTFEEGMGLVQETSSYLEGPGRNASRELSRAGALSYAAQSMRLTTRLMQMASWLLVHRAVREGELTNEEARAERYRLLRQATDNAAAMAGASGVDELPGELLDLIERCDRLYVKVSRLDERLSARPTAGAAPNPVGRQLAALEAALTQRPGEGLQ